MRIVKEQFLKETAETFPQAASWLESWRKMVRDHTWKNLHEVRQYFPSADGVKVKSGRTVVIFNVCGNKYRLIAALHYDRQIAFTLRFFNPR